MSDEKGRDLTGLLRLTEDDIRRLATAQSFTRGEDYYASGAVFDTQRRGKTLIAQVEGSQYEPYQVTITLDEAGVQDTNCTCPYDRGGICKHIIAVLLTYIHKPDSFTVRPEPAELLAGLDGDTLRHLLTELLTRHPDLLDEVEAALATQSAQSTPPHRRTPLNPAPYRRQVISILHSLDSIRHSEAYWAVSGMVSGLRQVLEAAEDFLAADDGESALVILQVLSEEVIETYPEFEYAETDVAEFIEELGQPLAEAILNCDLTPARRQELLGQLTRWADHLDDYGVEEALDAPITAARQGWSEAPSTAWDGEEEWPWADLSDVQLNVLERRGEADAFLALALQTGRHRRYALKLVELGRAREATAHALDHIALADDALALADQLREAGDLEAALSIAERGLDLEGHKHRLGVWLSEVAAGLGQRELALRARQAAFEALPSLEDYQALRKLAGDEWAALQPQLMKTLRQKGSDQVLVDVLLSEGQVDEAIGVTDRQARNYRLLEQVADAVIPTRPEWVIRVSQREAEGLINRVQSKYYQAAVRWLERARAAYRVQGQEQVWRNYLQNLRQRHSRKRTLLAMLDRMDGGSAHSPQGINALLIHAGSENHEQEAKTERPAAASAEEAGEAEAGIAPPYCSPSAGCGGKGGVEPTVAKIGRG